MLSAKLTATGLMIFALPLAARADTLATQEITLTNNAGYNTTPVGTNDSIGPWVVYASTPSLTGTLSTVAYQRIDPNGPVGAAVQISTGSTSDQLEDADAHHVVYTAYTSASSLAGSINAYDIATGTITRVANANSLFSAHVCGDHVIWLQGTSGAVSLMLQSLGTPSATPVLVAGPAPSVSSADVGERFIVWESVVNGQRDVYAYDLSSGVTTPVANDPNANERLPRTSGAWVVWQSSLAGVMSVGAYNMDTQQRITVAQGAYTNGSPTVDGNLIAYQANPNGRFDVYVYRIPTGDTFQATHGTSDELLSDVFGNAITYEDNRSGKTAVYVTWLTFAGESNTLTGSGGGTTLPVEPNGIVTVGGGTLDPNAGNGNTTSNDGNSVDANTVASGGGDTSGGGNTVASGGNTTMGDPSSGSSGGDGNTVATNPNTSDGNTSNPNGSDPNDTGYHGGCDHRWCDKSPMKDLPLLSVSWRRNATHVDVGFCKATPVKIPSTLPATDFLSRSARSAYLLVQTTRGDYVLCTYTHAAGRNSARPYMLTSCTHDVHGGDTVSANYVDLRWQMGTGEREEPFSVLWLDPRELMAQTQPARGGFHFP